jgi:hypothetical protein
MSQREEKNTLLISVGSFQLITQYLLSQQKKIDKNIIGVIRIEVTTDGKKIDKNLEKCEEFVCKTLNLNQIAYVKSVFKIWGKNKYKKLIMLPFLKRKIQQEYYKNGLDIDKVENVILAARYDIGESLLLSIFRNLKNVYFVSDGNPKIYKKKKFKLPFYLRLFGFKNPYKGKTTVFFYKNNLPNKYAIITPEIINNDYFKDIKKIFLATKELDHWLKGIIGETENSGISLFYLHPIEIHLGVEISIDTYIKIIKSELKKSDNLILIKHHPRESEFMLRKLKGILKKEFGKKIRFLNNSYLSRFPVDIYFDRIGVNRVITLFSTAALFAENAKVIYYTSRNFPSKYVEISEFLAKEYDDELIFV